MIKERDGDGHEDKLGEMRMVTGVDRRVRRWYEYKVGMDL